MSEIFIPQIITITDGHEHGVDLESYQFTKERKVKLIGEINAGTARSIVSQLDYLDGKGDDDIHLIINSPGGTVSDGMMIYDAIKHGIHCDVRTVATGMAASMGAFLLAAGTKGKRFAMPNAEVMIHQPLGGFRGRQRIFPAPLIISRMSRTAWHLFLPLSVARRLKMCFMTWSVITG